MREKEHKFSGQWITDKAFSKRKPVNVFHRQLTPIDIPEDPLKNSHVLYRKKFNVGEYKSAKIFITADDYYKLYINGVFVAQGPAPSYPSDYNYNEIDVSGFLVKGENTLAVHTYYQGLINRVWVSGDFRQGLICDIEIDGKTVVKSDESFKVAFHTAYSPLNTVGYDTQFCERYDNRKKECDFYRADFDDSGWQNASVYEYADYKLKAQQSKMLVFEEIAPVKAQTVGNVLRVDFGKQYVGYLLASAKGKDGDTVLVRYGQELNEDGSVRYKLRCNCEYQDEWILSGEKNSFNAYDYKTFRYVEFILPKGASVKDIKLLSRHYPFTLNVGIGEKFKGNEKAQKIFDLCVNSIKYGVQEVIQDCMDREKGFYLGDGCYSALCHYVLTGDDSIARKMIDDAFYTSFISSGLMTCLDCSMMQEIAEFPLILINFLLWHYNLSGDKEYLKQNYVKAVKVLDTFKNQYEKDGVISNLDRWCVVEWPKNYQDEYAVDILEGKVCVEPHVSINAYYLHAVKTLNKIAEIIGEKPYRDYKPLEKAFINTFYDKEKGLFVDGKEHRHISMIGNVFPYAFGIIPDEDFKQKFLKLLDEKGYGKLSLFTFVPLLSAFIRNGEYERLKDFVLNDGNWQRMIDEGATTTFEAWGKGEKWNTSLFHLTFSTVAVFMTDVNLEKLFNE